MNKEQYYAAEIAKLQGKPLHFEIEDGIVTSPEHPGFIGHGDTMEDIYYELCEWMRNRTSVS